MAVHRFGQGKKMTIADDPAGASPDTIPGFPTTRPRVDFAASEAGRPQLDRLPPETGQLSFSGDGAEYFKIWAVNLALTIVTLGIYSAWAKVRRLRYLYGNTTLEGSTFDFHGQPAAILRGRIIALVFLVLYTQSRKISFTLFVVTLGLIAAIFPWIFYRSLRFRLANTSFRGVRFHFGGTIADAYALFIPAILLVLAPNLLFVTLVPGKTPDPAFLKRLFMLYLLVLAFWPYFLHKLRLYQHGHAFFGSSRFDYVGHARMFYFLALKSLGLIVLGLFVLGAFSMFGAVLVKFFGAAAHSPPPKALGVLILSSVAVFYAALLALIPYWNARSQNIIWNNTRLAGSSFESTLFFNKLFWVETQNFFLTIVTLGIYRPFAVIRSVRIRLEAVRYAGEVGVFEAASVAAGGATGAEFVDMFGFDISL
jgi:uncharacterized membrane protein YjgN (DUF898 family)